MKRIILKIFLLLFLFGCNSDEKVSDIQINPSVELRASSVEENSSVYFTNEELQFHFSSSLNRDTLSNIKIFNDSHTKNIDFLTDLVGESNISIVLNEALNYGENYTIDFSGVKDLEGLEVSESFEFKTPFVNIIEDLNFVNHDYAVFAENMKAFIYDVNNTGEVAPYVFYEYEGKWYWQRLGDRDNSFFKSYKISADGDVLAVTNGESEDVQGYSQVYIYKKFRNYWKKIGEAPFRKFALNSDGTAIAGENIYTEYSANKVGESEPTLFKYYETSIYEIGERFVITDYRHQTNTSPNHIVLNNNGLTSYLLEDNNLTVFERVGNGYQTYTFTDMPNKSFELIQDGAYILFEDNSLYRRESTRFAETSFKFDLIGLECLEIKFDSNGSSFSCLKKNGYEVYGFSGFIANQKRVVERYNAFEGYSEKLTSYNDSEFGLVSLFRNNDETKIQIINTFEEEIESFTTSNQKVLAANPTLACINQDRNWTTVSNLSLDGYNAFYSNDSKIGLIADSNRYYIGGSFTNQTYRIIDRYTLFFPNIESNSTINEYTFEGSGLLSRNYTDANQSFPFEIRFIEDYYGLNDHFYMTTSNQCFKFKIPSSELNDFFLYPLETEDRDSLFFAKASCNILDIDSTYIKNSFEENTAYSAQNDFYIKNTTEKMYSQPYGYKQMPENLYMFVEESSSNLIGELLEFNSSVIMNSRDITFEFGVDSKYLGKKIYIGNTNECYEGIVDSDGAEFSKVE